MLSALRAKRGWPRAIALLLLFAFTASLAHVHPLTVSADAVTAATLDHSNHDGHDHGHDHDGAPATASGSCGFCAAVAGKFFLPTPTRVDTRLLLTAAAPTSPASRLTSAPVSDLFRPPIPAMG